ncbi:MAG: RnfH family protein [Betaproteobacteria bacterium]|nr:RnfH family protein [Betaproteobacteria bacterium]
MRILVVIAAADRQDTLHVEIEEGASVAMALAAARVAERHPGLALDHVGVWGKRCTPDRVLRDADRVEVYRPLLADPKAARRARAGL